MHRFSYVAAVLLSSAWSVSAGTAHVVNNCGGTVYFASVAQLVNSNFAPLPASGYSETYSKDNVGVSIKLSPDSNGADVTQFEYTWTSSDNKVAYDISNINGNPFASGGMSLVPSVSTSSEFPTCVPLNCPAGQSTCTQAYNQPDDIRTMVCPDSADLVFTLCPGGASAGGNTPSASQSGNPAPSNTAPAGTPVTSGRPVASSSPAPQVSTPAAGTPAAGTPTAGTPAAGTPTTGTPAAGSSQAAATSAWNWGGHNHNHNPPSRRHAIGGHTHRRRL